MLLDADWALNAGNWMWLSASAFYYLYYRVYSPVSFGKKTDKDGQYIRKYVPELQNYPKSLIYEPWKATVDEQKHYKCIIGKEYPERIVIHEDVLKSNMAKMALAYKKHKEGGGGKFDVDNVQIKKESDSPSQSTFSRCSNSKIRKVESTETARKLFKSEPKSP